MPNFALIPGPNRAVSVTGYQPKGGLIRARGKLVLHSGPTIELTLPCPLDDPRTFNVAFPSTPYVLRQRVAFHGMLLSSKQCRALEKLTYQFVAYIVQEHGWSKPWQVIKPTVR